MADPASAVRQLAASLHAQDAATLLRSKLPYVLDALKPGDIAKIQKMLDAGVVDPVLRQQYAAATRKEIAREHAHGIYRDPSEEPVRFSPEMRRINDEENYIHGAQYGVDISVDYQKLLAPGALTPDSDHPAEGTFLQQIRQELDRNGVTLHIGPTGQQPPNDFALVLFGPGKRVVNTDDGRLTTDNLLECWLRPIAGEYQALRAPVSNPTVTSPDGTWFGLGVGGGGTFFVAGRDALYGFMYSFDKYEDSFPLQVTHWRVGLGLGGSFGGAFIVAVGGKTPQSFDGLSVGGFDFKAALGAKWGDFAKGVQDLDFASKIASSGGSFFSRSKMSAKLWQATAVAVRDGVKASLANVSAPAVVIMPIPLAGAGVELSVYYAWGDCSVL